MAKKRGPRPRGRLPGEEGTEPEQQIPNAVTIAEQLNEMFNDVGNFSNWRLAGEATAVEGRELTNAIVVYPGINRTTFATIVPEPSTETLAFFRRILKSELPAGVQSYQFPYNETVNEHFRDRFAEIGRPIGAIFTLRYPEDKLKPFGEIADREEMVLVHAAITHPAYVFNLTKRYISLRLKQYN